MRGLVIIAALVVPVPLFAHGGGLDASGCHMNRKTGEYHCHRAAAPKAVPQRPSSAGAYYPNCATARADGVTPIYLGEPGYSRHLDRDGDGIACE